MRGSVRLGTGVVVSPQLDSRQVADECRRLAIEGLETGDWHLAYNAAKGWVTGGGGAWSTDPWLVYVASALLHRQPKIAVHSCDLALSTWVEGEVDRAVIAWARGNVVFRWMNDPKTAQADLDGAVAQAPDWLRALADADAEQCRAAALVSRKRKPGVTPAPDFSGDHSRQGFVSPPLLPRPVPGEQPSTWYLVRPLIQNDAE